MTRALQLGHLLLLLAGIAFMAILGWRAWTLADSLDAVFVNANGAISRLDGTLEAVNRPCGTGQPCGTLATVNKTVVKIGDAVVTTQRQEGAITPHTIAAMDNLNRAADALTGTASAATGTLHSASDDLKALNTSIAATKPLLETSTATVRRYETLAPALSATAANLSAVTGNLALTTGDFQTKFHAFLYPPKCKSKWCKVKRVWPYIHGGAEMAEPSYWAWQLFRGATP